VRVVERQRHTDVSEFGDDVERVGEAVIGESVGAVSESQAA
jgi:hypothetical protein